MVNPPSAPDFHTVTGANPEWDFEAVVESLRCGIREEEMILLHEIDTAGVMRKAGIEIGDLRQLLYFHPRWMQQVLATNPSAVIEAPLKLVVRASDDGVSVRYIKPSYLFGRYQGLEALGAELEPLVERIVAHLELPGARA